MNVLRIIGFVFFIAGCFLLSFNVCIKRRRFQVGAILYWSGMVLSLVPLFIERILG